MKLRIHSGWSLLLFGFFIMSCEINSNSELKEINIKVPVLFPSSLNPLELETVGAQIILEHILAYNGMRSLKDGFVGFISKVSVDDVTKIVKIKLNDTINISKNYITLKMIYNSLKKSLEKTAHARFKNLVKNLEIKDDEIQIEFFKVPNNLFALLSLPDFSIYNTGKIEINPGDKTLGPYHLKSLNSKTVELTLNPNYPQELMENNVPNVKFESYSSENIKKELDGLQKNLNTILYISGDKIDQTDLKKIDMDHFKVDKYGIEWITMIGFNHTKVSIEQRHTIGCIVDDWRDQFNFDFITAQPAYSLSPSSRVHGIKKDEYEILKKSMSCKEKSNTIDKLKIAIRHRSLEEPILKSFLKHAKNFYKDSIEVVIVPDEKADQIYSENYDAYICAQGISSGDPAHHFSFFLKYEPVFKKYMDDTTINNLLIEKNQTAYIEKVKDLEKTVILNRVAIPLAHHPGIVIRPKSYKVNFKLAGDWGVKAWAYKVD